MERYGTHSMTNLFNVLHTIANDTVATNGDKVEQKASRAIKERITAALFDALVSMEDDVIKVVRTRTGVAIAIDNDGAGMIPVEFSAVVKNLDFDIYDEADAYQEYLDDKAAAEAAKAKAKAEKIAKAKAAKEARARAKAAAAVDLED